MNNAEITSQPEFMGGPFAAAVREAVFCNNDNWEANYYRNQGEWPQNRRNTFMQIRCSALGPEWQEFIQCVNTMRNIKHSSRLQQLQRDVEYNEWCDRVMVQP